MGKTSDYLLIGGGILAIAYFWNTGIYNAFRGIYDSAAEDRDKTIRVIQDETREHVIYPAKNVVDELLYGPVNEDFRPPGTYNGWTGVGVLPERDTGTGIIPTLNRYEKTYREINQEVGEGMQSFLGTVLKISPFGVLGMAKDAFGGVLNMIMPRATAQPAGTAINPADGTLYVVDDKAYLGEVAPNMPGTGGDTNVPGSTYIDENGNVRENWFPGQTNIGADGKPIAQIPNGTLDQVTVEDKILIPGFNTPMPDQGVINLPVQDNQVTIYNAPRPLPPRMCPDGKGNMVVCP